MHSINVQLDLHNTLSRAIKYIEKAKFFFRSTEYVNGNKKEGLDYILRSTSTHATIIDLGEHKRSYIFDLLKIAGHSRNVVVFERSGDSYCYLQRMKRLLRVKNVVIENYDIIEHSQTAPVIAMKERKGNEQLNISTALDNYFTSMDIEPHLVKLRVDGNALTTLKKLQRTLKASKPKILIECIDRRCERENLTATFLWLDALGYRGYFLLENMKIAITSFNFNLYQNEISGFYCNNFVFE
jgi:hypothetical protein